MDSLINNLKSLIGVKAWDYTERRKAIRVPCRIDGTLQKGEGVLGSEIRNIGIGGLQIKCFGKVKKGDVVRIRSLKEHLEADFNTIQCRVEWVKKETGGSLVGLSFQEKGDVLNRSWLIFELKEMGVRAKGTKQKRDSVRVNCLIPARVFQGADNRKARIRDLGPTGARVECPGDAFVKDDHISLRFGPIEHLPKIEVNCDVVSTRDFGVMHYGLSFSSFSTGSRKDLEKYMNHFFKS